MQNGAPGKGTTKDGAVDKTRRCRVALHSAAGHSLAPERWLERQNGQPERIEKAVLVGEGANSGDIWDTPFPLWTSGNSIVFSSHFLGKFQ